MSALNSVSPVGTPNPVTPGVLPTSIKDKFDTLFKNLFEYGESISLDAEETLAGLGPNQMDGVWYTECHPYLIRVVAFKDDGAPGVEVSLSKKKSEGGTEYTEFSNEELALLHNYQLALFNRRTKKVSLLRMFTPERVSPCVEFGFPQCDEKPDASLVLPTHAQVTDDQPYAFSIVVQKKSEAPKEKGP